MILFGNYNQDCLFNLAYTKKTREIIKIGRDGCPFYDNDLYAFPFGDFEKQDRKRQSISVPDETPGKVNFTSQYLTIP